MGLIQVIGVGLEAGDLTLKAAEALRSGVRIVLHTEHIGCAAWLKEQGIAYESLDFLYDECGDFDEHAERAAGFLMECAEAGDVVYAVYDVRDRTVLRLSQKEKKLRVVAGPPVEGALMGFLDGATRMLEASDWENFRLSAMENALVRELNNRELASEVKLKLMECYPDETRCFVLNGDGSISRVPLYDLDRLKKYDHRSCALVFAERDLMKLERFSFDELVQVMRMLQGPDGCPWDKAQTHESLRPYMLEETYEAIDCINQGDTDHLYDELGDILMQVVMHAEIARNHGEFDITDSITAICDKMIQRHTHIFGKDSVQDADSVLDLWTKNKMKERGQQTFAEVLREVSHSVPALMRGCKLIEKAARAGVNCADAGALLRDMNAQLAKMDENAEQALGNALLMLCAVARARKVDLEIALNEAADRFIDRFAAFEQARLKAGESLPAAPEHAEEYWNQVKL